MVDTQIAPPKVIIIEDEAGVRDKLGSFLGENGFAVETFPTISEEVRNAIADPNCYIVSDLTIEKRNVPDQQEEQIRLAPWLHANVQEPGRRLITMSAFRGNDNAYLPRRAEFVEKPFDEGDLAKAVLTSLAILIERNKETR